MGFLFYFRLWLLGCSSIAEVDRLLVHLWQSLKACWISWNLALELPILRFPLNRPWNHCIHDRPALPGCLQREEVPPSPRRRAVGAVSTVPGNSVFSPRFGRVETCFSLSVWVVFGWELVFRFGCSIPQFFSVGLFSLRKFRFGPCCMVI
ncbi:hypothetical protein LINPERHAP1_LOCUS39058 [Linum perenne]